MTTPAPPSGESGEEGGAEAASRRFAFPAAPDFAALRRLERRVARAVSLRAAGRRWVASIPPIVQLTVAAVGSYLIAHYVLEHENPVLAVTVTITSLGFNRDARPVRVLRSVCAILLGVLLATGLIALFGQGAWQLAVVLIVVFSVARLLVRDPVFATSAATNATVAAVMPITTGGLVHRVEDAALAAAIALLITVLIPRSSRRIAERDGRGVFSLVAQAVEGVGEALQQGDPAAAELALDRLRRARPLIDAWSQSLDTAKAVARMSPWLRSQLPELERARRALRGCESTTRHLALIARRAQAISQGERHPEVGGILIEISRAIGLLGREQEDLELVGGARSLLGDLAGRLDPAVSIAVPSPAESALVVQCRPLVVDLLVATGLPLPEAQARLAEL